MSAAFLGPSLARWCWRRPRCWLFPSPRGSPWPGGRDPWRLQRRAIHSLGIAPEGTGTKQGTTWTWTFSPTIKGQKIEGRCTLVETSPTSYTFKEELEQSGKWTTTAEGKSTKKM